MAHVKRFDHVGITVADLESATAFFVGVFETAQANVPDPVAPTP